jgi:hypothetical protein
MLDANTLPHPTGPPTANACEEATMLERLDTIDWATFSHAYGSAEDVPALIRALRSPDPETRDCALSELFSTIWHQGTV